MNDSRSLIQHHFMDGDQLNVEDLNVITVLVDRSQACLTEIGWNSWRAGLEGPPHSHSEKDQIFYITDGRGRIVFGEETFDVSPGDLVYVPMGRRHQTVVEGAESLSYVLYNFFRDASKEGHSTFADHIDKVKHERKAQASAGWGEGTGNSPPARTKPNCFRDLPGLGRSLGAGEETEVTGRADTLRCSVRIIRSRVHVAFEGNNSPTVERALFVIGGTGRIQAGTAERIFGQGDLLFIPPATEFTLQGDEEDLVLLDIATHLD